MCTYVHACVQTVTVNAIPSVHIIYWELMFSLTAFWGYRTKAALQLPVKAENLNSVVWAFFFPLSLRKFKDVSFSFLGMLQSLLGLLKLSSCGEKRKISLEIR